MSGAASITCRELVELVTEYLEGGMPAAQAAEFEEHLATCPSCVVHLEQIRVSVRATGRLGTEQLSPELHAALLEAFRDWKRDRPGPQP